MSACKVCASPEQDRLEALGREALSGDRSWNTVSSEAGVSRQSLKNHMESHVVAPAVAAAQAEVEDQMDRLIAEARAELEQQFYLAPPDVKPLILVAMQNLDGLRNTKPSQESLIRALKTVQEMTGMKNEQRMLLGFAKAMFGAPAAPVLKVPNEARALGGGEAHED